MYLYELVWLIHNRACLRQIVLFSHFVSVHLNGIDKSYQFSNLQNENTLKEALNHGRKRTSTTKRAAAQMKQNQDNIDSEAHLSLFQ